MNRGEVRMYPFERPDKTRPTVIVTRQPALRFLTRITVAPVTTTIRGIPTEVQLGPEDGMREPCAVNLDNLQTVPMHRLGPVLTTLSAEQMARIDDAITFALGLGE